MSKIAFLFPGQGSQNVGMGKELYDNFKEAKEIYEKASDVLNYDIMKLCFDGPLEELTKTENAQPAILTTSIAAFKVLEKNSIKPDMCAGHSLGEYSAYVAAGWFSFEDGLIAVRQRGLAMAGADPEGKGTMAAIIGADVSVVEQACKEAGSAGIVVPANFNTPNQIVISGEKEAVHKAMEIADEKGAKMVTELTVSGAFHSPLMEGALDRFKTVIEELNIEEGYCPVIANVNADVVSKDKIKNSLIEQMTSSVQWTKSIQKMIEMGAEAFVEVGSGKILRGLMRKIDRKKTTLNVGCPDSLEKTLESIKN